MQFMPISVLKLDEAVAQPEFEDPESLQAQDEYNDKWVTAWKKLAQNKK